MTHFPRYAPIGSSKPLGFLKSLYREHFMAMFHAYFDESGKQGDHPLIALAAVCGTYAKIQKFEEEWNTLLRRYGLQDFHMVKASRYSRKWGNVPKQSSIRPCLEVDECCAVLSIR